MAPSGVAGGPSSLGQSIVVAAGVADFKIGLRMFAVKDDVEIKAAAFADTCTARMPLGRKDLPPAPGDPAASLRTHVADSEARAAERGHWKRGQQSPAIFRSNGGDQ